MKYRFDFSAAERRALSALKTPAKIQDFLDRLKYNLEEDGETLYSPRLALREGKADCIEGAILAAAALRCLGYPPLIMNLRSVRDDDHVVAVFSKSGGWGALSKSKYTGLRYREPIHRNLRELALTYFESYFNYHGEKTMRGYSKALDLSRFDDINWMTTETYLYCINDSLQTLRHYPLLGSGAVRSVRRVTPDMKDAGELWMKTTGILAKARAMGS